MNETPPPLKKREHGFWLIFFAVFAYDVLAFFLFIGIASSGVIKGESAMLLLFLLFGLPFILTFIKASKGQGSVAGKIAAATIIAPIIFAIIGVGACFAVFANY